MIKLMMIIPFRSLLIFLVIILPINSNISSTFCLFFYSQLTLFGNGKYNFHNMKYFNVNRLPHKFIHILMKINKFCFWFTLTTFYLLRLFLFSYLDNIFQFQQLFSFICLSQNGHINSSNSFFIITCDILKKNVTIPYFRENSRFHKNSHGVTLPHTIFFTWRYHPLSTSI